MGLAQKFLEVISPMGRRKRPVGNQLSQKGIPGKLDWLLSQPHTDFQGSWTGLFRLPGSGQDGILGSWRDTGEACNRGPHRSGAYPEALSYHKGKGR